MLHFCCKMLQKLLTKRNKCDIIELQKHRFTRENLKNEAINKKCNNATTEDNMFKKLEKLNIPYERQGLIYFTCMNYKDLPPYEQEKILQLCIEISSEHYQALFKMVTTDSSTYPVWKIATDYYLDQGLLYKLRRRFYQRWNEDFKKRIIDLHKKDIPS